MNFVVEDEVLFASAQNCSGESIAVGMDYFQKFFVDYLTAPLENSATWSLDQQPLS
jgi:hypothetical protein